MEEELRSYGQEHILSLNGFNTDDNVLLKQLKSLNIGESLRYYEAAKKRASGGEIIEAVSPLSEVIDATKEDNSFEVYRRKGEEAIAASSVAMIIMSGGQGTRLNFDGPKGMYNLNLPSKILSISSHA